jgi:hypothetical protein
MGNKKNEDKWSAADHLRIKAFARSLASGVRSGKKPKASDIQKALSKLVHLDSEIHISDETIRSWLSGEKRPSKSSVNWIKQGLPECAEWLEPDMEGAPLQRLLCALDIWGSGIDSATRKLETTSTAFTVGKGLVSLARRWGPVPIKGSLSEDDIIPRLKRAVPRQVPATLYQSNNILTLIDFVFRCGAYIELTEDEFKEWALDLASLTLMVGAFIEGESFDERHYQGTMGGYNWSLHRIFFKSHGNWPDINSVKDELEKYPELNDAAIDYPARLMHAREVLRQALVSIGSDLSIASKLFARIKDRSKMWQE